MKEIGEKLRAAREEIGISLEEAGTDLKIDEEQLNNLENGNTDSFKDIINVKYLIRDYAKYLGLNKEDLVDDFNEYLFDYTSKISLEDIKEAKSKKEKETPKVKSPYTTMNEKKKINVYILLILIIVLVGVTSYIYIKSINDKDNNVIAYVER
ncbi:MAG: helix-turn-helix domain-containing protein [Bacilli bacterium]|nr:helix-turn-helix domain-containing protein [Bacilli bacterium]